MSVNLEGLKEITCALNVERFMLLKVQCQWIRIMVYVDDTLLPELCPDYKYFKEDIERSAYELLSPPFTVKQKQGAIQIVVKTGGPGKVSIDSTWRGRSLTSSSTQKWPDYVFQYNYFKSSSFRPASFKPAPLARSAVSKRFVRCGSRSDLFCTTDEIYFASRETSKRDPRSSWADYKSYNTQQMIR